MLTWMQETDVFFLFFFFFWEMHSFCCNGNPKGLYLILCTEFFGRRAEGDHKRTTLFICLSLMEQNMTHKAAFGGGRGGKPQFIDGGHIVHTGL